MVSPEEFNFPVCINLKTQTRCQLPNSNACTKLDFTEENFVLFKLIIIPLNKPSSMNELMKLPKTNHNPKNKPPFTPAFGLITENMI